MGLYDYLFGPSTELITDIDALKAAVDLTKKRIRQAKVFPYFEQMVPGVYGKFTSAEQKLAGISSKLEGFSKLHAAAKSMERVRWATNILNNQYAVEFDSKKAGAAFGVLLVEFGGLASLLPAPVNGYGQALAELGNNFSAVVNVLVPQYRKNQKDQWDALGFKISM